MRLGARGVIESRHELTLLDDAEEWWSFDHSSASSKDHDDFAEREPALAQLASAAVSGRLPAGPELRQRQPIALRGEPGIEVTAPLSGTEMGFSLHAATTASAEDSRGREALVRYALRPPIAQERLHILPDNLVRIELKRPFRDGDAEEWSKDHTVAIDLDPLSLLCRLAASVPPPGFHLVHYAGVLGTASKLRALVVPPPPPQSETQTTHSHCEHPPTHRCRYRPWAELLKRTFQIDVEICPNCGDAEEWWSFDHSSASSKDHGRLKLRALVIEAHNIERLLRHLGEPLEPPKCAPARDPPYFQSQVLRRMFAELN